VKSRGVLLNRMVIDKSITGALHAGSRHVVNEAVIGILLIGSCFKISLAALRSLWFERF
jgi:hypothetical protein